MAPSRILIVKDDAVIVQDLKASVEALGYFVVGLAASGDSAIHAAEKTHPDLVLMDIALRGDMDGIEAADRIRTRFNIPVIYLTAYAEESLLARAKLTRPHAYLVKPFQDRELHAAIEIARYNHAMEAVLLQSQTMEAVGRLAGSTAHQLNNLMTGVIAGSQLMLSRLEYGDPMRKMVEGVKKAGERTAALAGQLLTFSHRTPPTPIELDLNAVVTSKREMLETLFHEFCHVQFNLDPALGRVKANPDQMSELLLLLVLNAHDAMSPGDSLTIETINNDVNGSSPDPRGTLDLQPVGIPPGAYVRLTVSDTGCGMDAAAMAHCFEPFFTTKETGKGTGLGLSTVYGAVTQNGGHIRVESVPGEGTAFAIYLPRI